MFSLTGTENVLRRGIDFLPCPTSLARERDLSILPGLFMLE